MRILITGATGLVGNNCLRILASQQHDVSVLVRSGHDERPFKGLSVARCVADLSQPESLSEVIPEVDAVIHSAGDTHIGAAPRPMQHTINVEATEQLAKAATRMNAKFVFVSSVDALPAGLKEKPANEQTEGAEKYPCGYVRTKRFAEAAVRGEIDAGLDATIVNPGFMLGPWDWKPSSGRMLLEVATRFTPFGPKGGFSVCDVRDVAAAICKIATSSVPSRQYILAGNNVRYIEAWKVFAEVSGGSKPICPAGPLMRIIAGRWGDAMASITGNEGDVNSAAIGMSDLYHYYDSSLAQAELDYAVRPVEESALAAWQWFRENGYVK